MEEAHPGSANQAAFARSVQGPRGGHGRGSCEGVERQEGSEGQGEGAFTRARSLSSTLADRIIDKAKAEPATPAREPADAAATPAPSLKIRLNGSAASSPATANGSHKRHSRSSPSPTSLSPSDESAPPPRKRLASSASTSVDAGALSGTSTSGRTLRVRLPKKEVVEEEPSDEGGRRRSTRASAQKAKGKLAVKDEEDEDEGVADEHGGADEPAEEASDEGFEFDEDF